MRKAKEFQDQSLLELKSVLQEARQALFQLRNERIATKKLDKPHLVKHKKTEIARILTVMRQKQLLESEA